MLDHVNLPVSDLERSRRFYEQALTALDCKFVLQDGSAIGFGRDSWSFGIVLASTPLPRIHVAFAARDREQVDRFYRAALAAGGVPNGSPGIRSEYDPNYYAAFVLDPDGHNVEAVCRHGPP